MVNKKIIKFKLISVLKQLLKNLTFLTNINSKIFYILFLVNKSNLLWNIFHNKLLLLTKNVKFFNIIFIISLVHKSKIIFKITKLNQDNILLAHMFFKKHIYFFKMNINYFYYKKINMLIFENYILKLNFLFFLLYNNYIIYVKNFFYNEYINKALLKHPILKLLLKYIKLERVFKLKKLKKNLQINFNILKEYQLFNILVKQQHNKIIKVNFFKSIKSIKLYNLLKKLKLYNFIDLILLKMSKINLLFINYIINIYFIDNDDWVDINKLNIKGLFNMYWQMSRYGFNLNYYYFINNLIMNIKMNLLNINIYNNYYLKYIILKSNTNYLFWYKIFNVLINKYMFYFLNLKNKTYKKKKKLIKLFIKNWYNTYKTYCFSFLPIKINLYYSINLLKNYLKKKKYNLDLLLFNTYTVCNVKLWKLNLFEINKKSNISQNLLYNFDYYINITFFLLIKKINKFFFNNLCHKLLALKNMILKSLYTWKKNNILLSYKYTTIYSYKNLILFNILNNLGFYKFNFYLEKHNCKYIWSFESAIIYNNYISYIYNLYYKLTLIYIIFIYKKYLLDN